MSKPTCTIQAWLWQSHNHSRTVCFFSLFPWIIRSKIERMNQNAELREREWERFCMVFSLFLAEKWLRSLGVSLFAVGVCRILFYLIIYDFCMCASCSKHRDREREKESEKNETRFMGLLKFMTIAFHIDCVWMCLSAGKTSEKI